MPSPGPALENGSHQCDGSAENGNEDRLGPETNKTAEAESIELLQAKVEQLEKVAERNKELQIAEAEQLKKVVAQLVAQLKKVVNMNRKADLESIELHAKVEQLEKAVEMNKKADAESKELQPTEVAQPE